MAGIIKLPRVLGLTILRLKETQHDFPYTDTRAVSKVTCTTTLLLQVIIIRQLYCTGQCSLSRCNDVYVYTVGLNTILPGAIATNNR